MLEVVTWLGAVAQVYQRSGVFQVVMDGFVLLEQPTCPSRSVVIMAMEAKINQ